jgi:hypothetical protein
MGKNLKTEHGLVNRKKLEQLQESYDTSRLLDAVDMIDRLRNRICDPEGIRSALLDLHRMAMDLINEEPAETSEPEPEAAIWSLATDLEFEISEYGEQLRELANLIEELSMLAPAEDWDDDEE